MIANTFEKNILSRKILLSIRQRDLAVFRFLESSSKILCPAETFCFFLKVYSRKQFFFQLSFLSSFIFNRSWSKQVFSWMENRWAPEYRWIVLEKNFFLKEQSLRFSFFLAPFLLLEQMHSLPLTVLYQMKNFLDKKFALSKGFILKNDRRLVCWNYIKWLSTLHDLVVPFSFSCLDWWYFRLIDLIKTEEPILYFSDNLSFSHADLHKGNIGFSSSGMKVIDWSGVTVAHWLFDIASFLTESLTGVFRKYRSVFLNLYNFSLDEARVLKLLMNYHNLFWFYWAEYLMKKSKEHVFERRFIFYSKISQLKFQSVMKDLRFFLAKKIIKKILQRTPK